MSAVSELSHSSIVLIFQLPLKTAQPRAAKHKANPNQDERMMWLVSSSIVRRDASAYRAFVLYHFLAYQRRQPGTVLPV